MSPSTFVRAQLRAHIGYLRLMEWRNKLRLGPSALVARRFEDAEVSRLIALIGDRSPALVATVIATYRRPELLPRAVASVLAQTVADQVIIVVDDGGGVDLAIDDPRVVTVSLSKNTGVLGLARNVGIRLTRSEYIAFLDDDNEWEPDHLEVALSGMRGEADLVYTALRRMLPDGRLLDVFSEEFDRAAMSDGASPADSNSIVVRRDAAVQFSRMKRGLKVLPPEDWELVFRLSRRMRVKHVPKPTVRYLVNPASYFSQWTEDLRAPDGVSATSSPDSPRKDPLCLP